MSFVIGDIVRLKSGGPVMTIEGLNWGNENEVRIAYFAGFELKTFIIKPDCLEKVEKPDWSASPDIVTV